MMLSDPLIGRLNTLRVVAPHPSGILLDGGGLGEILLPNRYVPKDLEPGGDIEVFLMTDSEDRLVATTERPLAMAGEFALLEVVATTGVGAFLNWGMPKDLLLPFSEQLQRVRVGQKALVYIRLDQVSGRLLATARLRKFIANTAPPGLYEGTEVSLLMAKRTDLGLMAIVDNRYWGLLHTSAFASKPPRLGDRCTGYIARISEDGLVDLTLERPGYKRVPNAVECLTNALKAAENGFLPLHDKSPAEEVSAALGMSKKVFKQAVGSLYRAKLLRISDDGIQWLSENGK